MPVKSSRSRRSRKSADRPKKPHVGFPLTPHASGAWQKKIRGKVCYFGRWARRVNGKLVRIEGDGWKEALEQYKAQADDLHAGRTPRTAKAGTLAVRDLCNAFLTAKQRSLDASEITSRTFAEYRETTDRLIATFGKDRLVDGLAADDFGALRANVAKVWGPFRLANMVQRVRTVFKYGYESGLIEKPVRFGPEFKKPSKAVIRKHRAAGGKRLFTAAEIHALVDAASPQLKAMILLGINAGLGNADCGSLPQGAIDLDGAWIAFPRPKTGIERRCPLWPQTAEALKVAIAERPTPKDRADAGLVFLTKYGRPWSRAGSSDAVTLEFGKLLRKLRLDGRRGIGFYALRHTFRTVADAARDVPAVRIIMGHADGSIDDVYRETIDDDRLRAVTDHVHAWLFPSGAKRPRTRTAKL